MKKRKMRQENVGTKEPAFELSASPMFFPHLFITRALPSLAWDSPTAERSEKQNNTIILPQSSPSSGRSLQGRPEGRQRGAAAESSGGVSRDDPPSKEAERGCVAYVRGE